jgi:hypothetical protein
MVLVALVAANGVRTHGRTEDRGDAMHDELKRPSTHHVMTSDPKIAELFENGLFRSATFRLLVATLDMSDVIVYVHPKTARQALGGYLAHTIVVAGGQRYVHIAIDNLGAKRRLISLFAHELQHAVEVAQHPDVRDAQAMEQLFNQLAIKFGCDGTTCSETKAAKHVEAIVRQELAQSH